MHAFRRSALILWALCTTLFCLPTLPSQGRAASMQAEAERQFQELHQRMQNLEAVLARTEPDESSRLEAGNRFVQERALADGMAAVQRLIEGGQYDEALTRIDDLQADLQSLLNLLLDRDAALRDRLKEIERLENYRRRVEELLDQQTAERDAAARSAALERHLRELDAAAAKAAELLQQQQDLHARASEAGVSAEAAEAKAMADREAQLQERTEDLTAKLRKIEADAESLGTDTKDGAGASAQAGENAAGAMGQAKQQLGQNQPERSLQDMDRAERELQSAIERLERLGEEARRKLLQLPFDQQMRAQERTQVQTDKLAQDMEKDDRGQPGEGGRATPGKQNVQQAVPKQKAAAGQLKEKQPAKAESEQEEAVDNLEEAQKQLEDALAQLRQELQDEVLRALEERFAAMLTKQRDLTARTKVADQVRAEALADSAGAPAQVVERANAIAVGEHELAGEAADALSLLREEGTSAAFPAVVELLRDDLTNVAGRLERTETGRSTQAAQAEIEQTLADLIDALRRQIEENQDGGGACNCNGQPVLVPTSAELKLVMIKQKRVNRRTREFDSAVPDQLRATEEARAEAVEMAHQQGVVEELLRKMADKMSKEGEAGF